MPKVSVLMPTYNCAAFLKESIESILTQTFKDFEFIIINDGSTDASNNIINEYVKQDSRIKYFVNEKNIGLIKTLNFGLTKASGEYIVRMDADDISLPERIEKQVKFMDAYKEICVCGTQVEYFGAIFSVPNLPCKDESIKAHMIFNNTLAHPSVIIRNEFIKKNQLSYNLAFLHIEDYELWTCVANKGRFANLNEVLLKYRVHGQNISLKNGSIQKDGLRKIYAKVLESLGIDSNKENIELHTALAAQTKGISSLKKIKQHAACLVEANIKTKLYDNNALQQVVQEYWDKLFFLLADTNFNKVPNYWMLSGSIKICQVRYVFGIFRNIFMLNK